MDALRWWLLIRREGRKRVSDGMSSIARAISSVLRSFFLPLHFSRCCRSLALKHGQWRKKTKETTTEPVWLLACLPRGWHRVTGGRTRLLMDRHSSVTDERYNRLASYVNCQWRHAVRFIHTNVRRPRMTDPEDTSIWDARMKKASGPLLRSL